MILNSPITDIPGVGEELSHKLKKLGIFTVGDLLHHIPSRYVDYSKISNFNDLKINEPVTIEGQIVSLRNIFTKSGKAMQEGIISNGTDTLTVVWFNQTYIVRTLKIGTNVALTGKVSFWGKKKALFAPQYEIIKENKEKLHSGRIISIYHETSGVTSKWLRTLVNKTLTSVDVNDFLSEDLLLKNNLMDFLSSLKTIHQPDEEEQIEKARSRLALNELLLHTIAQIERRQTWQKTTVSKKYIINQKLASKFLDSIPFKLTTSQARSIQEITNDLEKNTPMNRLLEGDVGSGKTVVAAYAAYLSHTNDMSAIIMAPTQLLAEQHFKTLSSLLSAFGIKVVLVTSKQKTKKLTDRAVYVGTHALLNKLIRDNVGLVVIDEQHRFGVKQRAEINNRGKDKRHVPHTLTMTATPIPRTIALTLYGDLDISTLDELPSGRKKIKTWVIAKEKRAKAYEWIQKEIIENKSQAFVVCPLIDESTAETMKEVKVAKTEFLRLKKIFKTLKVELLHGKMKINEKNKILDDFRNKKIDILVSTPVVEVGIDIPNATIMMIESSERFGLAALHQLRGRVGRGDKQSYCLLFTESKSENILKKLTAMSKTLSGRELAELDLELRGPGEIFGTRQSGLPELRIARWTDINLIKLAKEIAQNVMSNPDKNMAIIANFKEHQTADN